MASYLLLLLLLLQAAMEAEIRSTLSEKGRSTSGYSGFERSLARLQGECMACSRSCRSSVDCRCHVRC